MSDRVVRIASNQGFSEVFDNATPPVNLNLVDFRIPAGMGVVDLSKSFISFNTNISAPNVVVNAGWYLGVDAAEIVNVPNSALVRNCSIACSSVGQMESIIRQDSLACGIWGVSHTAEEKKADMNTLAAFNNGAGNSIYTTFGLDRISNNVTNDGTTDVTGLDGAILTSANIDRDLKIPLRDIFGCGNIEDFDTSRWGEVDIHLETNFNALKSKQWGGDENTLTGFNGTTEQGAMEDIVLAAVGDLVTELVTKTNYGEWEYTCPFYAGQSILLSATADKGTAPADVPAIIKSIQFQNDNTANPPTGNGVTPSNNNVKIVLETGIAAATVTATTYSDIVIKAAVDDAALQNVVNRAELVLFLSDATKTADAYEFMTYTSEQDNGNTLTSFNKGYMMEPDAENVFIAALNNGAILPNKTIQSYRYAIDNAEQTGNRDITIGSPLQYDRLQRCLEYSAQIPFRNAQMRFYRADQLQAAVYSSPISLICETLQTGPTSKMLNLNIECSAGLGQLILYKQIPRQIAL